MTSLRRFVASQRKSAGTNVGREEVRSESSAGVLSRLLLVSPLRHSPSTSHRALPLPRPQPPSHHITSHDQSLKGIYMPNRAHTPTSHRGGATQPHRRRSSSHSAPHPPPPPFRPTPALRSPHGPPSSRTRRLAKSGGAGTSLVPCRQFARSLSP